jgi:hypothetical protein
MAGAAWGSRALAARHQHGVGAQTAPGPRQHGHAGRTADQAAFGRRHGHFVGARHQFGSDLEDRQRACHVEQLEVGYGQDADAMGHGMK